MIKIQTKYYNASNNFSAPVKREPKPYAPLYKPNDTPPLNNNFQAENEIKKETEKTKMREISFSPSKELSLKTDDLLLIGLIILLLPDVENNLLLVLLLGYLLIAGM